MPTNVTGNVNAGGDLSVGSGTIDGYCGYDTTNFTCSNGGCASVTVGIVTTVTCTANGSFKPPAGVTLALVEAWGGGGGGGAATGLPDKGGGGAGGQGTGGRQRVMLY